MSKAAEQGASAMLDMLKKLDKTVNAAYYEMGCILTALADGVYDVLGYESFSHLVEDELSFTPSAAHSYMRLYKDLKRLKYNKKESLDLIDTFSKTNLVQVLPHLKDKVSKTVMKNRIAKLGVHQVNFMLDTAEYAEMEQALDSLGVTLSTTGRRMHSSDAFMSMCRATNSLSKKVA
jgi:hypothetical protein